MTASIWSATWPTFLPAKTSGCAFASETVSGSSGHPGFTAVKPASSNNVAQRSQLRSEEHTSELQSQSNLVCRLLLEKKKPDFSLTSPIAFHTLTPHRIP